MAGTIGGALARLRVDGFEDVLSPERFEQLCSRRGHVWRRRLSPAVTLRLFLLQVLHGNVAINALRQLSGIRFAAASYCQARARLPLSVLQQLVVELGTLAQKASADADHPRVYVVDSTGCSMPDTPALRRRFTLPAPARVGVSYPMAMIMGLLDLASGLFVRAAAFAVFVHDQRGFVAVHEALHEGDIVVGDRAFCSFAQIALLRGRGVHCCLRVHQRRRVGRLGVTRWSKPRLCPPWMGRRQFDLLPAELTVRLVRQRFARKGYRTKVVLLVTTLLDHADWSDARVAQLYRQRWQIETCFAHLKTTMKMDVLKCQSVEGVLKELAVYLIVYNLVRLAMLRQAAVAGVNAWRVSFIDALRLLCVHALGLPGVTRLILNPDRIGRRQLRVRRRRPKHFTLLQQPRARQPDISYYRRRR
jgi:hypothetical protein